MAVIAHALPRLGILGYKLLCSTIIANEFFYVWMVRPDQQVAECTPRVFRICTKLTLVLVLPCPVASWTLELFGSPPPPLSYIGFLFMLRLRLRHVARRLR